MPNPDPDINGAGVNEFTKDLSRVKLEPNVIERATKPLDNVASYDFAFYEYLLPTQTGYTAGGRGLSAVAQDFIRLTEQNGWPPAQIDWLASFLELLEDAVSMALLDMGLAEGDLLEDVLGLLYFDQHHPNIFDVIIDVRRLFDAYGASYADKWAVIYSATVVALNNMPSFRSVTPLFARDLSQEIWLAGQEYSHDRMRKGTGAAQRGYPFEVFPAYSVNVGIRLVYRQNWKPLAAQPGEIVRTIPLGPGQKERVTTKVVRRQKLTSAMETSAEKETTTEIADSTKESSEFVREVTESSHWNEELEVSGKFFSIGGSSKTTFGEDSEDKSKNTSSHLSEKMKKTASKLREQTKVVVSTESEFTFEQENFSEISNPNNEVAITYEYHKLQQQYEVFTFLAEVESVIFVAERVPSTSEVNAEWVRRHDWIIAKVLKDESFRATLNELIQDADDVEPTAGMSGDPFYTAQSIALAQFARFEQNGSFGGQGLSIPDIYGEPQRIYQQELKERAARARGNVIRDYKRNRLFQHLRDNILYYCRAIWAHEDHDQRILRYKKEGRQVPIQWQALGANLGGGPVQYAPTGATAPLWEMIDPTGPIGYSGNYAVFRIRPLPERDDDFRYEWRSVSEDTPVSIAIGAIRVSNIVSLGFVLGEMRRDYADGEGNLFDPALEFFRRQALELQQKEPQKFNSPDDDQVIDILSYVPRLGKRIRDANGRISGHAVDELERLPLGVEDYAEYLYRKNGTRRFLVDSNNLYLNIYASEGVALEPFKRAHRYIDVLKEYENLVALQRKNERRETHMRQPDAYDPDIGKVIIIGDGACSLAAQHAALQAAMDEASGAPAAVEASVSLPIVPSSKDGSGDGRGATASGEGGGQL